MPPTSLGPWGHVVMRGTCAVLVDVPYFSDDLANEVRKLAPGGVTHVLLTHDDFVHLSNHASWKAAFPDAIRVAHCKDCESGSVEVELSGRGPWDVAGFRVQHVPGHSAGSVLYASPEDSAVFAGDSIGFWGNEATGFPFRCRFGLAAQAKSLRDYARTAPFFKALLPSHGLPRYFEDKQELVSFFDAAAGGLDAGGSLMDVSPFSPLQIFRL